MVAAIYARKSTDQSNVSDEQKSVARQLERARAYAQAKGWIVAEDHVYVDDGVSGAEFASRPGFVRLMNAVKGRAPFQTLIMSEESRLGREAIETAYALKQLVTAGVRVFFYLEDRERTLDSPADKIMLSLTAFADELERERARQRTYDAMQRKARAGHVTGGRTFGYQNVVVLDALGHRSHVERRIVTAEADVVRRIYEMAGNGLGLTTIVKTLNAERVPAPRPQRGRPQAWAPSSVRKILHRPIYRGEIAWNKTRKRNKWGRVEVTDRPSSEWMSIEAPELRIVSDEVWRRVAVRLADRREVYRRGTDGKLLGRPARGYESRFLLPGLSRCDSCGGAIYHRTRHVGGERVSFYGCTSYHLRGRAVCANNLEVPMLRADAAILDAISRDILRPSVVGPALRAALKRVRAMASDQHEHKARLDRQRAGVTAELERLTAAIAAGGPIDTLVTAVQAREAERSRIAREIGVFESAGTAATLDVRSVEAALREKVADWRALLGRQVSQSRQVLKTLLAGPIRFIPHPDERCYEFSAPIALARVMRGAAPSDTNTVTSPSGRHPS